MLNFSGINFLAREYAIGTTMIVPFSVPVMFPGKDSPIGFSADSLTTVLFICRSSSDIGVALMREKALNAAAKKLNCFMVA